MSTKARWGTMWSTACLALGGATSMSAASAEAWFSASGSPRCAVDSELLTARVAGAVVGELDPKLRAAVMLRDSLRGTVATLSLSQGQRSLGRRQLIASSCEEALDAVVAVTALALSSTASGTELPSAPHAELPSAPLPEPQRVADITPAAAAREPATPLDGGPSEAGAASARRGALLLSTGVDLAGRAAALLSVGAELRSEAGAWRALLRYGLPSLVDEEEAEPQRSLKARSERGAVAFDYCRDADAAGWLALCAGLELGAVRHWRAETSGEEARRERRWLEPVLAAALGSRLSYRDSRWQPGVELSMILPVLDEADAPRVGLRAQAGVAVPF